MAESRKHASLPSGGAIYFHEDTESYDAPPPGNLSLMNRSLFLSTSSIQSMDSLILRQSDDPSELITQLKYERATIQKKTFTNWCNSKLSIRDQIVDLYTDFQDGMKLIKLLEILSRRKVGKVSSGKMRIHHMQNLQVNLS